jgi:branched-chain amino acid aminotransferase
MGSYASIDGRVVPLEEAQVSVGDNGFVFGDSVYETVRTYAGRPFALGRHLRRLRRSASRLGIGLPLDDPLLGARLDALLERARNPESYVRIILSRGVGDFSYRFERVKGPTLVMVVKPLDPFPASHYERGVPVAVADTRRNSPRALDPAIKSSNLLNNILATREAQSRGAFEAILLNERDELAEGAGSNLFLVRGGVALTPPLSAGLLPGITRELVLELAPRTGIEAREETLRLEDLLSVEEAFLTSTLKEILPITSVDGRPVGAGVPGLVTLRLLRAYRELVAGGGA